MNGLINSCLFTATCPAFAKAAGKTGKALGSMVGVFLMRFVIVGRIIPRNQTRINIISI